MDVRKILYTCERSSMFSHQMVDNLLVPLLEKETGVGAEFSSRLRREYGHIEEKLPGAWHFGVGEQFIAYKLFGREGLAKGLLNHPQVKKRSNRERDYLKSQLFRPWYYAFIRVLEDLGNDLFTVFDLLSQEELLLYSPGIAQYEAEGSHSMYFTLLSYNGQCHQTYGPIAYFRGIQPGDLLFYARQLGENVPDYGVLQEKIAEDPLPFLVLFIGGNFPLTVKGSDIFTITQSEIKLAQVDPVQWQDSFLIEEAGGVYQFGLKRWRMSPHFCHCYFSLQDQRLIISAGTERGYERLVEELAKLSLEVPQVPEITVTMAGIIVSEDILQREVELNPYERLFVALPSGQEQETLDKANNFMSLLLPYLNSKEPYDLAELAQEAGIGLDEATDLARFLEERFSK